MPLLLLLQRDLEDLVGSTFAWPRLTGSNAGQSLCSHIALDMCAACARASMLLYVCCASRARRRVVFFDVLVSGCSLRRATLRKVILASLRA